MFFDPWYFLIVMPFALLAMWATAKVKGTFAKYSEVPIRSGYSGGQAAQAILRAAGLHDVELEEAPGMLSDHYDPIHRRVRMSREVLHGRSAASVAVAAHECGHALQHAAAYAPMKVRHALAGPVTFASQLAIPMILFGFLLQMGGLIWIGIIGFSLAVLFHLVTLPVEFDASHRAMKILESSGIVAADEMPGVRKTLYAAGFTYIAATLVALAQLVYFLSLASGRSNE